MYSVTMTWGKKKNPLPFSCSSHGDMPKLEALKAKANQSKVYRAVTCDRSAGEREREDEIETETLVQPLALRTEQPHGRCLPWLH